MKLNVHGAKPREEFTRSVATFCGAFEKCQGCFRLGGAKQFQRNLHYQVFIIRIVERSGVKIFESALVRTECANNSSGVAGMGLDVTVIEWRFRNYFPSFHIARARDRASAL